jgi:uncharacterized protein YuzE
MRITYDALGDVAYISLDDGLVAAEGPRDIGDDIYLDFDSQNRLIGIELLDASIRLNLPRLKPFILKLDGPEFRWNLLLVDLYNRKWKELPLETAESSTKHWIEEIAEDAIKVRSDLSGQTRKITRTQLENLDVTPSKLIDKADILHSLWELGRHHVKQ